MESFGQSAQELRNQNFQAALTRACEKYPELAEKIKISLETPQLGVHHNEGPRMGSHLALILEVLEEVKTGNFHETLADHETIRNTMRDLATNPVFVDYILLHDISKPDCLLLKVDGEKGGVEITWEQWKAVEAAGEPYKLDGKQIQSISYYHPSEETTGQHGNKAAELLKDNGVPPEILIAISKHEVAYQFAKINAATYEEHFVKSGFTEEQQKFILVASYIDTMGSLLPSGKPDLSNFVNLIRSRDNYLLINEYVAKGIAFRENELGALKKQDRILTREDIEKIMPQEKTYNAQLLEESLGKLVTSGAITDEEKTRILSATASSEELKKLGAEFGRRMKDIKLALEQSVEKKQLWKKNLIHQH